VLYVHKASGSYITCPSGSGKATEPSINSFELPINDTENVREPVSADNIHDYVLGHLTHP
jgi:hypothetical protein